MLIIRDIIKPLYKWIKADVSRGTSEIYIAAINEFIEWLNNKGVEIIEDITLYVIEEYKQFLKTRAIKNTSRYKAKALDNNSIRVKIAAVKKLLKFCNRFYGAGLSAGDVTSYRVVNIKHMDYFEDVEIEKIRQAIYKAYDKKIEQLRALLFIEMAFSSGARLSELLQVKAADIKKLCCKIIGKGGQERIIYFNKKTLEIYEEYSKELKRITKKNKKYIFALISHGRNYGKRISKSRLWQIVDNIDKLAKKLGINDKRFTPHTLRHSTATYLLDKGVDIKTIQEYLGHKSIESTQMYIHIKQDRLKKCRELFN